VTDRGRLALLLAVGVYLAAWTFGSTVLYPVAVGLALAVALAVAWVRLSPLP
jgi:predicted PurR-regulated permease PerM